MNYAIIDLGSNSLRLEIFKYEDKKLSNIFSKREVVGLASYLLPEGYLSDLGIDSVIRVVKNFLESSKSYAVEKTFMIATATIRDARNQNEVLTRIKRASGIEVELLDEDKEGLYGYKGVSLEHKIDKGLVVDIGGGSTEVSLIESGKLQTSVSLNLGSLNTYITFVRDIFPTPIEIERIKKGVINALKTHKINQQDIQIAYGIGGTIHAALVLLKNFYQKSFRALTRHNVQDLIDKIDPTKKKTYLSIIRMIPERTHTIMPGLIILETIMEYFNVEEIIVSKYGIREGYLLEQIQN